MSIKLDTLGKARLMWVIGVKEGDWGGWDQYGKVGGRHADDREMLGKRGKSLRE